MINAGAENRLRCIVFVAVQGKISYTLRKVEFLGLLKMRIISAH